MLAELRNDKKDLAARLRETHGLCDEYGDVASASLLETWIDEAEKRTWFLFGSTRTVQPNATLLTDGDDTYPTKMGNALNTASRERG